MSSTGVVEAAAILLTIAAADDPGLALSVILENIEHELRGRTCCRACGCLCLLDEICPGCHPRTWVTP